MRVNDFYYGAALIPIRGYLDITMSGILLRVKAQFKKILQNGRLLPQIAITECRFELDTNQIKFDFGGDFLLTLADLIIPIIKGFFRGPIEKLVYEQIRNGVPTAFNSFVLKSQGFFNLGDNMPAAFPPKSTYASVTLDYQLDDDFLILKDRMMFGINGTFFNRDKGYTIPANLKEPRMPLYDPKIPAKFQLFLSNYFLETFLATFLEKKPFVYELKAWKLNNKVAPFTTSTFEAVFPYLSSKFGKHIPMDLILKIKKIYAVECFAHNGNTTDNSTSVGMI